MNKALYIATIEPNSGKSLFVLGLMELLLGKMGKVGYFRPVIDDPKKGEQDNHIQTVLSYFQIKLDYKDSYAFTRSQLISLYNQGKTGEILDTIIAKYKQLEEQFDFILLEGSDFTQEVNVNEFDINLLLAKNLGIPAVIVGNCQGKTKEELLSSLELAYRSFEEKEVSVVGIVANKVRCENLDLVKNELEQLLPKEVDVFVFPRLEKLSNPTLREIKDHLGGQVLFGEQFLNNQTGNNVVGAMQLRNYLAHLKPYSLVITSGDRADIILGALQANLSDNYPRLSGIILSGGLIPENTIMQLIDGFDHRLPIISVPTDTFTTAHAVGNIKAKIYAESKSKILASIQAFNQHVDAEALVNHLMTFLPKGMTPRMFQYMLMQRAKVAKKHIVLPEGEDERILTAASQLAAMDIVKLTLLGNPELIEEKANRLHLNLHGINIIDHLHAPQLEEYTNTLFELRKHKNVNRAMARDMMTDVSYFGTMMVYKGDADGMVSGAAHATQHTIRPALQFIKTRPGVSTVSSIFFMCLEDRVTVMGDCAINPNPTAEQLAEIAISSADSSRNFGIDPLIAMLSYSSGASGKGEDVEKIRRATTIVKEKRPDLKIEGPIQYDAAVEMSVASKKLPDSEIAGRANVLIFPDLNTGNNTYKAVQWETGAIAIGPMLQGLNKPINDLSRGCTIEDIFNTVIITAIQAQGIEAPTLAKEVATAQG